MNKLKLQDITVYGEGQQIKNFIVSKCGSIKKFYDKYQPPITYKTLLNYIAEKKLRSDPFKYWLSTNFDIDYNEIVTDELTQIKKLVDTISINIISYKSDEDYKIIDEIEKLLQDYNKKFNLSVEIATTKRNKAKHFYLIGKIEESILYYTEACKMCEKVNISKYVIFGSELADMLRIEGKLIEAEKQFMYIEKHIEALKLESDATYKYYYLRGIMYSSSLKKYEIARALFLKGLEVANRNNNIISEKGALLLNIALSYKREGSYNKALDYYFESLTHFEDKRGRSAVYNNIAELYRLCGKYSEAIEYVQKAINMTSIEEIPNIYFIAIQTLTEINLQFGKEKACIKYFELLEMTNIIQVDKKVICDSINSVANLLMSREDIEKLSKIIIFLQNNTNNNEYVEMLYKCLGKLYRRLLTIIQD